MSTVENRKRVKVYKKEGSQSYDWTPEVIAYMEGRRAAGATYVEIAEDLGVSAYAIYDLRKRTGILVSPTVYHRITMPDDTAEIVTDLRKRGMSTEEIAAKLGVAGDTFMRWRRETGYALGALPRTRADGTVRWKRKS